MTVDREGILSELKPECAMCDVHKRIGQNTRCRPCLFIKHSAPRSGKPCRIAVGARLTKYGLPKELGKYQFFYLLYHPELNWEFPQLPVTDMYGNYNKMAITAQFQIFIDPDRLKEFKWIVHHVNGFNWDDRIFNLLLVLNTEHGVIHGEDHYWKRIQQEAINV